MGDYDVPMHKLEKAMATHSTIFAWKSHGRRSLVGCSLWGCQESERTEWLHFHFHALEKEMATHSSVLAWRIPRKEEPGGLPSMGSHRVRQDWSDLAAAAACMHKSSVVTNEPLLMRMSIMGEAIHVWRWGYMGNLYTFPSTLLGI